MKYILLIKMVDAWKIAIPITAIIIAAVLLSAFVPGGWASSASSGSKQPTYTITPEGSRIIVSQPIIPQESKINGGGTVSQKPLPTDANVGCLEFGDEATCGNCGSCANGGSDYTVRNNDLNTKFITDPGGGVGYGVSTDISGDSGEWAYMCMDWTAGSSHLTKAEKDFKASYGQDVYFGVGTDGCSQTGNMGGCYRITYAEAGTDTPNQPKDIIVQAVNSGADVHCPQFDLQVGVGGTGAFNNCHGSDVSMFEGNDFGEEYGGWKNKADCSKSPKYPKSEAAAIAAGDNLIDLCELSFDRNFRGEGGANSVIRKMSQVTCPTELTNVTNIRRADQDTLGYDHNTTGSQVINPSADCGFNNGGDGTNCLSRMMDCRKPSAAFKDNVDLDNMIDGQRLIPACVNDGYTRIVSDCGGAGCYW
jgi:hypothetical protein